MSYVFDLSPSEKRQQLQSLTQDWDGQSDFGPSATEGALKGIGMGIERGVVRTAGALANVATGVNAALGTIDQDQADSRFSAIDEFIGNAVDYWTPNTGEVGKVGQTLGSLGEIVAPLVVGRGNASLLAMTQTMNTGTDLIKKGVDADTALNVGAATGAATMLGAWLPVLGKSLTTKILGNAAINSAMGGGVAAVQSDILDRAGYEQESSEFDPYDMQARTVEFLMGAAFGAIARGQTADMPTAVFGKEGAVRVQSAVDSVLEPLSKSMKPSDIDAAFAGTNIKHFQIDSAAGRPANPESWAAHSTAMDTAIRQLSNGEQINVARQLDGAEFVTKPQTDYQRSLDDVLKKSDDLDALANRKTVEPISKQVDIEKAPAEKTASNEAAKPAADIETDAEIAAIQQHIEQHGDFDVSIAAGDDGTGRITKPASELLAEADAVTQEADTMGKAIMAASRCFMGFGQ